MSRLLLQLCLLATLCVPCHAFAQGKTIIDTYSDVMQSRRGFTPINEQAFGASVNLADGSTVFGATDVDVPTNSGLLVSLRRKLAVSGVQMDVRGGTNQRDIFGLHWDLDVPYMRGMFDHRYGWVGVSSQAAARCDDPLEPAGVYGVGAYSIIYYEARDYWGGNTINIPGEGEHKVLSLLPVHAKPLDGKTYKLGTASNTRISCLAGLQNGAGQGFEAVTTEGVRFRFDWIVTRDAADIIDNACTVRGCQAMGIAVPRAEVSIYATRVEDRFGNWVSYTYDAIYPSRLKSIVSNDGARIDLAYDADGRIATATSGARVWRYNYTSGLLSSVTQPDSSAFTYAYQNLLGMNTGGSMNLWSTCQPHVGTMSSALSPSAGETGSITIGHPAGATAVFRFRKLIHGTNRTSGGCQMVGITGGGVFVEIANTPKAYQVASLYSMEIAGPAISPTQTWSYYYEPSWSWFGECSGTTVCGSTSRTRVTDPSGAIQRYTHGNSFSANLGQLLKVEIIQGGQARRTTDYTYLTSSTGQPFPDTFGAAGASYASSFPYAVRPMSSQRITQDGEVFSRTISSFDSFARATRFVRSSTLGQSREEGLQYFDERGYWVLGQLSGVMHYAADGSYIYPSQWSYYFYNAKLANHYSYGRNIETYDYSADGTLLSVKDQNQNETLYSSYRRGIPRSVVFADSTSISAAVSDHGEVTSVIDQLGNATTYGYDAGGRINRIDYPASDSVSWSATTIAYQRIGSAEFGIPAGHWRRTESTSLGRKQIFYDGLWRPILEKVYDSANNVSHFLRRSFDHAGRVTLESYPVAAVTNYSSVQSGISSTYDALSRKTSSVASTEIGAQATAFEYLTDFQTKVTSPRGHATTTTYFAWDEPTYEFPKAISAPEGRTTTIARDSVGKPLAMVRSGTYEQQAVSVTRRYVYDEYQRLCKTIDPEAGASIRDYDPADNVAWTAPSATLTSSTACNRESIAASARSSMSYDQRNRLLSVDHPIGTADAAYTYFADGKLKTASSDGSVWTYAYNKRRLLESEQLTLDGKTFLVDWAYNAPGHVSGVTYPSAGSNVLFNPDPHGRPRQAGGFANGGTFHPDGALAGFTYGNGVIHQSTRLARMLPSRTRDYYTSGAVTTTFLDHTHYYDEEGNLEQLVDGATGGLENRVLQYDGANRLTYAAADNKYGVEQFWYDPADNVRRTVLGPLDYRYVYEAQRLDKITNSAGVTQWDYSHNTSGEMTQRTSSVAGINQSFTFDKAHRLTSAVGKETYRYDAHGNRVLSTRSSGTKRYQVYSQTGRLMYAEDTRDNQRIEYIHLADRPIARRTRPISTATATVVYMHTDARGTPSVETTSSRTTTSPAFPRNRLSPFGSPYDGVYRDTLGLTGHATDAATQLTYMEQRYYDPVALRFLSPDSVGAGVTSFNRYWYANNNPYRFSDPDGRQAMDHSAKYLAAYELCANHAACNPGEVPDRIAEIERPFAEAAGLAASGGGLLRGVAQLGGFIRVARAERAIESVVKASGGSLQKAIGKINDAGLSQEQALNVIARITEGSGRKIGGVADAAGGAKIITGVQSGRQALIHVAKDGRAAYGTGKVQFVREGGKDLVKISEVALKK